MAGPVTEEPLLKPNAWLSMDVQLYPLLKRTQSAFPTSLPSNMMRATTVMSLLSTWMLLKDKFAW